MGKATITKISDYLIINFYGELDSNACYECKNEIIKAINAENYKKVAMDFTKVTFIDSSGIGLILGRYQQLKEKGIKLSVYGLNKSIDKLFSISGLWTIIERDYNLDRVTIGGK